MKFNLLGAAVALGLTSFINTTFAVTEEPFIVSATRISTETDSIPAHVTIITAGDIRKSPARTLPELLSFESGITSRSLYGNNAARAKFDMRGFGAASGENVLVLLDGRRLNNIDLSGVDIPSIPVSMIERIEIIHGGSGSVLYGDGAVGGTINIITKVPGKSGTQGEVSVTGASYNSGQFDGNLSQVEGPYALNLIANAIESDGYRDNNKLEQINFQGDFRIRKDNGEIYFKLGADQQSLGLPGVRRVNPGASINELVSDRKGTDSPNNYAEREGFYLTSGMRHYLDNNNELITDLGYRFKNDIGKFDGGGFPSYLDTELESWSFTPRLISQKNLFGLATKITSGIDYYYNTYDSDRSTLPSTISTPIHKLALSQNSVSLYGELNSQLGKNTKSSVGLRIQNVETRAGDTFDPTAPTNFGGDSEAADISVSDTESAIKLGINQTINDKINLYVSLDRSFRIATIDEMFSTFPGTYTVLLPQTSNGIDVGMKRHSKNTETHVGVYYMNLRNEIHYNSATFSNENLEPTKRYGLEHSLKYQLSRNILTKFNYTYTRSKFRQGTFAGNDVPLVPKHTASLGFEWDIKTGMLLSTTANFIGKKRFDNDQTNTYQHIPSYTTVDVMLSTKNNKGWHIDARINNLFNSKAFDYAIRAVGANRHNAYPLPERNFSITLGTSF